jgi:hypothetical protein
MRRGSTNSTPSTNCAVRPLRRCEVFRSMMKQLGKQAGARTIRASPSLGCGGGDARLCGTRWGAVARVRREKMPHAGQLGKRMLNGHCQSAPGFGIGSPRCGAPARVACPANAAAIESIRAGNSARTSCVPLRCPIGGCADAGAPETRPRASWGARTPEIELRAGWGARAPEIEHRVRAPKMGHRRFGEGSSGISNARAESMMLSNSLGWKSWYGMCTKRAIMRPGTSVLTSTSTTPTSTTLSSMTWINEFERDTTAPGCAASR